MERLTRFNGRADQGERAQFGRDLLAALDRLGVKPGEEFLLAPASWAQKGGKLYKVASPQANAMGPVGGTTTSRKAALQNYPRSGTQRNTILRLAAEMRDYGITRDRVVERLGMKESSVHPRVLELLEGGWLEETDRTRPTRTGADAIVMVATPKGRAGVREEVTGP